MSGTTLLSANRTRCSPRPPTKNSTSTSTSKPFLPRKEKITTECEYEGGAGKRAQASNSAQREARHAQRSRRAGSASAVRRFAEATEGRVRREVEGIEGRGRHMFLRRRSRTAGRRSASSRCECAVARACRHRMAASRTGACRGKSNLPAEEGRWFVRSARAAPRLYETQRRCF